MLLTPMRYKSYIWPHNPAVYSITYQRQVAAHKVPFGRYCMQDLGLTCRVMRGAGEFAGADAYEEFKRLASVFYGGGPGLLIHPLWQIANAYFTALKLEQERRISLLRHGGGDSSLVVEQGVRHQCCYDTGYGSMLIGVSGRSIENDITDDGGCVHFQYSLDINTILTSIHDIYVTVKTYENELKA